MPIYHCTTKNISRGSGKSSVAAAAYRSGEKLKNELENVTYDYKKKSGVEHSEIIKPEHAPAWCLDREKLWNEVERAEKAKDARTAREIEIALPRELNKEQQIELIRDYANQNFVDKGMVCDYSLHDKNDGNPHAHLLLTTRPFEKNGEWGQKSKKEYIRDENGEKIRLDSGAFKSRKIDSTDWNKIETLKEWRENWEKTANKHLELAGHDERIDHRTLEAQGIERIPQIHIGEQAKTIDRKNIKKGLELSDKTKLNEEIIAHNRQNQLDKELTNELSGNRATTPEFITAELVKINAPEITDPEKEIAQVLEKQEQSTERTVETDRQTAPEKAQAYKPYQPPSVEQLAKLKQTSEQKIGVNTQEKQPKQQTSQALGEKMAELDNQIKAKTEDNQKILEPYKERLISEKTREIRTAGQREYDDRVKQVKKDIADYNKTTNIFNRSDLKAAKLTARQNSLPTEFDNIKYQTEQQIQKYRSGAQVNVEAEERLRNDPAKYQQYRGNKLDIDRMRDQHQKIKEEQNQIKLEKSKEQVIEKTLATPEKKKIEKERG